jgi:DNA-binding transcriptional MerR regulator/methylmalonyl-CoA mutase cobalamin-binding subunit
MSSKTKNQKTGLGEHPIQVVAKRTGLSPDVLRIWERRYGVVNPARSATGRRLYSDTDVEHLLLLRRATIGGRSISQLANLGLEQLRALVEEDEVAASRSSSLVANRKSRVIGETPRAQERLDACIAAIEAIEPKALESALSIASLELTPISVINELVVPLMHEIGKMWQESGLRVAHEHMASAVVRTFLGNHISRPTQSESAPLLIAGTPAGQIHEFGALIVVANAAELGWRSIYLGPNLPAAEFASVARSRGARVIALSLGYPGDDPHLADELREIRRLVAKDTGIVVGGQATNTNAKVLADIGAHIAENMNDLRAVLDSLRLTKK